MRVLLVSHHAPPHIGGVENLVAMEAEALLARGDEVVWVTSDGDGKGHAPASHPKLSLLRVPAWHWPERRFGIAYPLFAPSLPWHLWREVRRADRVHVHGLVFPGSPLAALFARLSGVRCLCTDHGGELQYSSRLGTWLLRFLLATAGRVTARAAHELIAYNRAVEALLQRLSGRRDKVRFLPNPVDVALFRPPTVDERRAARRRLGWDERPRVLCVSRLLPHKGIDVLLEARGQGAATAPFEVVFCGPGEPAMREHIVRRGGEVLAPRPQAELLAVYHAADAFALPSHNEGFPVVVQEALACGYAPYRDLDGLYLCAPEPQALRERLLAVLRAAPTAPSAPAARPLDPVPAWLERLVPNRPAEGVG